MNKKGEEGAYEAGRKPLFYVIMMIILTGIILVFAFYLHNYTIKVTQVPPLLEARLIAERFYNAPDCFAYQDPDSELVKYNSIDFSKYNEERLLQCYQTETLVSKGRKQYNFGLTLKKGTFLSAEPESIFLRTNNFYQHIDFSWEQPVLVWKEDHFEPEILIVAVQKEV